MRMRRKCLEHMGRLTTWTLQFLQMLWLVEWVIRPCLRLLWGSLRLLFVIVMLFVMLLIQNMRHEDLILWLMRVIFDMRIFLQLLRVMILSMKNDVGVSITCVKSGKVAHMSS